MCKIIFNLILILFLFYIINYLFKIKYENFDLNRFCNIPKSNNNTHKNNNKFYYSPSIEEEVIVNNCAGENEKCYTDSNDKNTCCGDYNCVRKKNNFGYKVCSYDEDACGYNKFNNFGYLKYLFDDDWWKRKFEDIKKIFYQKNKDIPEEEGDTVLDKKRKEIINSMNLLCGKNMTDKKSNDPDFITYVIQQLEKQFTNDQIFSGVIYGVKEISREDNEDGLKPKERSCNRK